MPPVAGRKEAKAEDKFRSVMSQVPKLGEWVEVRSRNRRIGFNSVLIELVV